MLLNVFRAFPAVLLALAVFLAPAYAPCATLSAVQNADWKIRRTYVLEGNVLRSRPQAKPGAPLEPCAAAPTADGAALVASGDQHLLLKDASGKTTYVYHTVTDTWCAAGAMNRNRRFSPLAWAVVAAYFALMAGMGFVFMRKKKDANDFFRGGQRIPWYVAGVSIFATMLSSITFLAYPVMSYLGDWRILPNALGIVAIAPLVLAFYIPVFRRAGVTSAYEYLERRFNLAARLFASGAFVVFMVCRVAVVTLLPAIALDAVTGMGVDLCIAICGAVTILYCALGGLEAVIWSDFIQGIVLVGGAVTILVALLNGTDGGAAGALDIAAKHGKNVLLDFRPEFGELVFWVALTLGLTQFLFSYTADQCVVQRYISVKDTTAVKRSIWLNAVLSVCSSTLFLAIGTALWTHYKSHPEMLDPAMPKSDSILPVFIGTELHPVLAGLVIAAVFAATISTLSANLSSAATALTTDFVVRFRPTVSDRARVRFGQLFVVLTGLLGTGVAFVFSHLDLRSLCDAFLEIITTLTAGLAGLFFLGIFVPRARGRAAFVALAVNYLVCFSLKFGGIGARLGLHPFMYGGCGLVACIVAGGLVGFLERKETTNHDRN